MHEVARVLFSNTECLNRFGTARPLAANAEVIKRMPITTRTAWRSWYQQIFQVSTSGSVLNVCALPCIAVSIAEVSTAQLHMHSMMEASRMTSIVCTSSMSVLNTICEVHYMRVILE